MASTTLFFTTNLPELRKLSQVSHGTGPDPDAIRHFCKRYWGAVYGVISLRNSPDVALDLTQRFFLKHLIEKNGLTHFDPERGRFRSWLWRKIQWFVLDERKREARMPNTLHAFDAEEEERWHPHGAQSVALGSEAQLCFERQYAISLARDALVALHLRWDAKLMKRGKSVEPATLVAWLVDRDYEQIASFLGVSRDVARKTVQRINEELWAKLGARIGQTVVDPEDFADEFQHVCRVLGIVPPSRAPAQ